MATILLWLFPLLLIASVPVAYAMIGASGVALFLENKPLAVMAQRLYTPTQSFPMLAIPFFILAGSLMMQGKFGTYLVECAKLFVGRLKGGMCHVSVLGSVMFGGVSGSAVADASALGNALIPVQKKRGLCSRVCWCGECSLINCIGTDPSIHSTNLVRPSIEYLYH